MAYFKVLSQQSSGGTDDKYGKPQTGYQVRGGYYNRDMSRMLSNRVTADLTCSIHEENMRGLSCSLVSSLSCLA